MFYQQFQSISDTSKNQMNKNDQEQIRINNQHRKMKQENTVNSDIYKI